ncbi:hypothetical protein VTK56DRAFT_8859 [Thermocarpiscus australiensis]
MNTSTTPYTPLETLLLFRGIAQYGLEAPAFARISEALQNNTFVRNAPTYDARRLSPESLQELFLQLLWEELKAESEDTAGPDGALSPASKKRRLQSSPLPTLSDARQHVEKIESAHSKLHDAYVREAVHEIRQLERQFDVLQGEIDELVKLGVQADGGSEHRSGGSNGPQDGVIRHNEGLANGLNPSPRPSPKLAPPHTPISQSPLQQPLRPLQPLLPHPAPRQDIRPAQQSTLEQAASASRPPALTYPQVAPSPQLTQQDISRTPPSRPSEVPRSPNGTLQVLQAPQGVPPFQPPPQSPAPPGTAEGLRRPEAVGGAGRSPLPPPTHAQLPPQAQLKWEPPYQPNAPTPRHATDFNTQHQNSAILPPLPPTLPSHGSPQQPPPLPSPLLFQGQPNRPSPQQLFIPPHAPGVSAPPVQSPTARSPLGLGDGEPAPNRQQPLLPTQAPSNVPQSQSPYHPPPYHGYTFPAPAHPSPVHPAPVGQGHAISVHSAPGRSPAIPSPPVPPATAPPTASPGLAASLQQRQQPPNLQAPPPYKNAPRVAPSPASAHSDASRMCSASYQPPWSTGADRIHPLFPMAATPTPPTRISPLPPAHTPAMALPPRLAAGSGTKWMSTSTPSTPKQGFEFFLGHDDFPSPAFEPTSPVLKPSVPPSSVSQEVAKEPVQRPRSPAETSSPKHKPGRQHVSKRAQEHASASPPAGPSTATEAASSQSKAAPPAAVEPKPPRIKDEVTTPQSSTDMGGATADESVAGRRQGSRSAKRKRDDLTPSPARTPAESQAADALPQGSPPPEAPKVVLWTRSFNKVCGSAMEQITHHRHANMFAAPIREKDAPGYHKVVKHPQDLKSIRAAISHGNRTAAQAAAALPDGDPGSSSVWLPRTEDLVPPRSIINSGQLDRELAHMFANAIMYNPDPCHGPGPRFLRDADGLDDEDDGGGGAHHHHDSTVLGYKVDEFGVVNDARAMFVEVEKLLSELRAAEIQRSVPPAGAGVPGQGSATGTSTRQASLQGHGAGGGAGGADSVRDDAGDAGEDADDRGAGTETETAGGAVKRRRVARG